MSLFSSNRGSRQYNGNNPGPVGCRPTTETMRLESWNFAYTEQNKRVSSMAVNNQKSQSACTFGDSFGFDTEKVWVDKGCRADFDFTVITCA